MASLVEGKAFYGERGNCDREGWACRQCPRSFRSSGGLQRMRKCSAKMGFQALSRARQASRGRTEGGVQQQLGRYFFSRASGIDRCLNTKDHARAVLLLLSLCNPSHPTWTVNRLIAN